MTSRQKLSLMAYTAVFPMLYLAAGVLLARKWVELLSRRF